MNPDPTTVHIDELHDGRYIVWMVWRGGGEVDTLVSPNNDIRSLNAVYSEIATAMLESDCGENEIVVKRHYRGQP